MTVNEAHEVLEDFQRLLTHYRHISSELTEANGLAIEAIEKQILRKPTKVHESDALPIIFGFCPVCNATNSSDTHYCHQCGQKIDWGE